MARIRYGKWGCWIPLVVGVLLSLFAVITAEPPGFLSIRCGGKADYTDENNIKWVTDTDYIDVGDTADIGNATVQAIGSPLDSLRFFPKNLTKPCYQLPVPSNMPYLLRLWFIIGNYGGFQRLPSFACSFETVDMLAMDNITLPHNNGVYYEKIMATSGTVMYVCLIRTSEHDDPFISGIELRPLRDDMYAQAKPGTLLFSQKRRDIGGDSTVRYPQDKFDRIWTSNVLFDSRYLNLFRTVTYPELISPNNTKDLPPTVVMQTAWVVNNSDKINFPLGKSEGSKSLLLLYFAELETLNMSEPRSFYVTINGETMSKTITLERNYSAQELIFLSNQLEDFTLSKAPNTTHPPIINAYEHFLLIDTQPATYSQDIKALNAIKRSFEMKDWISDPCYVIHWKGIDCDNSSSVIRISEINLSGWNITGSVPNDIVQLTALVNVSLDNNHLIGSFPNFSNLTMLERIYLQNNNLNGSVPEWLSELKNLKELNIENNNFSGVIPAQLLLNCSLKLNYFGNPDLLRINKRECTRQNSKHSNNNKVKVVLAITLSGTLIIALALIVGIVVHRKKFRRKEEMVATQSREVENEPKRLLYQDYSMVMVPNPTKSRAFTLEEMVAATQTFNREIGRGGFGSVFFGKLPEGNNIAVKVLSLFSHQGVQEFLNEVDLLSRINHRNLVSLLGYCNETREVMLIYEHMSGGSLKDHLYGSSAEHSELNWKRRLKIALDAAQGLEYLHVGSTPKIIHRDIKTANILLDSNMNGKLADFGLSKMTIDGEATHVTTAVKGTLGYLDPEYYNTQMLTEKSDVYSFGVVLLEIICGRQPIDVKLPEDEVNLIRWVILYVLDMDENPGRIAEIVDKRLDGSYDLKSIICVAKVAMRCVQAAPSLRPSVSEVVRELEKAMQVEDKASISLSEDIGIKSGDLLVGPSAEHSELNWKRRLKIALDAAQGLEYLHVGSTPKIIHRDIKTANILLDNNMNGKLADFGLSRMTMDGEATHVTTVVKGTAGYLDPGYYSTQMLTEKSDVYSFGVVLLEIICGRPPIDLKLAVHELNIVRWVTPYIMEMDENAGKITEIIDKRLAGSYNMKSITRVIMVAMRCVQSEPSSRPSVSEVVAELKEAMNNENIASISISEEIGIASGDPLVAPVYSSLDCSEPKVMEWSDNSSNISKVGR